MLHRFNILFNRRVGRRIIRAASKIVFVSEEPEVAAARDLALLLLNVQERLKLVLLVVIFVGVEQVLRDAGHEFQRFNDLLLDVNDDDAGTEDGRHDDEYVGRPPVRFYHFFVNVLRNEVYVNVVVGFHVVDLGDNHVEIVQISILEL